MNHLIKINFRTKQPFAGAQSQMFVSFEFIILYTWGAIRRLKLKRTKNAMQMHT